jgi:hypothetical protein
MTISKYSANEILELLKSLYHHSTKNTIPLLLEIYCPPKLEDYKKICNLFRLPIFQDLTQLFNNPENSDVVLYARDEPENIIYCHKLVIST